MSTLALMDSLLISPMNWGSVELGLTSVLLAFQEFLTSTNGLIPSNVSMNGGSWAWYMALTPFESLFLIFITVEICVLRYIEILPINLNNLLHGDPSGRKKRAVVLTPLDTQMLCNYTDNITDAMLKLITKLDQQECFLRTLCYMGSKSVLGSLTEVSDEMKQVLNGLKLLKQTRPQISCVADSQSTVGGGSFLEHSIPLEDAVYLGSSSSLPSEKVVYNSTNSTHVCEQHYRLCPLTMSDISHYLHMINVR